MKKTILLSALALTFSLIASPTLLAKDKVERPLATQAVTSNSQEEVSEQLQMININKADEHQLAKMLHGVGLKKAKAIVEYREQFGDFKSVNELIAVKGIGQRTLDKNKAIIAL
ncbi:MAG: helix-hairpin-helix domain-containing protein [Kangiellaceae bacterium]|nr:helix-hairpin-helix domain-containing protein [Kangiellaceae bacterium]